jgi:hypothetical protein
MFIGSHADSYYNCFIKLGIQMTKSFRKTILASVLAIAAMGSASANVVTTDNGVKYTSGLTGNVLSLNIDATNHSGDLQYASELDQLVFGMAHLQSVSMNSPSTGWNGFLVQNIFSNSADDYATFTAKFTDHTLLTAPVNFLFTFTSDGTPLDYSSVDLWSTFLTAEPKTHYIKLGLEQEHVVLNDVPEPASLAIMCAGLSMLGFMRRRKASKVPA